jgi:D-psicose/D-tagatose/L-ribulose 3-epimerase
MNKLGIHAMVFSPDWNVTTAREIFGKASDLGYDLVEVLMSDPDATDTAMTARLAAEYGVGVAAGICGTLEADLSNPDPDIAKRGEARIARAIAATRDMGATMLGGPSFSAVHRYSRGPSAVARERVVEVYGRLAEQASAAGIRIGLEALNRYESNFINTVGQAAELVRAVGSTAMFVHADLFHMNIEERELGRAIEDVADVLGYIHVTDSHRGPMGEGNINWDSFFGALARIEYSGPITFESFSSAMAGPDFANLVALWRDPWTDADAVAGDALAFLKTHLAQSVKVGV